MSLRVAVASSDGKVINQHFGRAGIFLVFDVDEKGYRFVEERKSDPPCQLGEHDDNALDRTVGLIADCGIVLASMIGPGAEQAMNTRGIRAYAISDYIDRALEKLVKYERGRPG